MKPLHALVRSPSEYLLRFRQLLWSLTQRFSKHQAQGNLEFSANFADHFFVNSANRDQLKSALNTGHHDYSRQMIEYADQIVEGKLDLLGFSSLNVGPAKEVNYHSDPVHDQAFPRCWWTDALKRAGKIPGDLKIVWELNRHQFLVQLGVAYLITGDAVYKKCAIDHLSRWMASNPPYYGINWSSALEVSFRAISWIWCQALFEFDSSWLEYNRFKYLLFLHGEFIEHNLSIYHSPNTHITGEALGLIYLANIYRRHKKAAQWKKLGERLLNFYADKHILPDGGYVERSFWYHLYTVDIYTHFLLLTKAFGGEVTNASSSALARAVEYLFLFKAPDMHLPRFGDDDGGSLLRLEAGPVSTDIRDLLCCHAVLQNNGLYKQTVGTFQPSQYFLVGTEGRQKYEQLALAGRETNISGIPETFPTGFHLLKTSSEGLISQIIFDCGPMGWKNCGHGHGDTLGFVVYKNQREVIIDPGTYTYKGPMRNVLRGPHAHAVLLVDNMYPAIVAENPFHWLASTDSRYLGRSKNSRCEGVAGELDLNYGKARKHIREIFLTDSHKVIIRDRICGSDCFHRITRQFPLSGIDWRLEKGNKLVSSQSKTKIYFGEQHEVKVNCQELTISSCYGKKEIGKMCLVETYQQLPAVLLTVVDLSGETSNCRVENGELFCSSEKSVIERIELPEIINETGIEKICVEFAGS